MTTTADVMLDTTPITTEITRLISTGTSEEALLTRSGAPVPELEPGRAVAGPAGRDGRGGAEGSAPTLKTATMPTVRIDQRSPRLVVGSRARTRWA